MHVSLWDLLARLQVTMPILPDRFAHNPDLAERVQCMLRPVASAVVDDAREHLAGNGEGADLWPVARLLAAWFEKADSDASGFLERGEFVAAVKRLGPKLKKA